MSVFFKGFCELLKRGGGRYFAANKLTIADLKMYVQLKQLVAGTLDHIPAEFIQNLAPELVEYFKQIEQEPIVVAYYNSLDR